MTKLTIALDVMGGDYGPSITLRGAIIALEHYPNLHILAFGDSNQINAIVKRLAKSYQPLLQRLDIVHCAESITAHDKPSDAVRHKADASMRRALEAVSQHRADACVSAGNTGALFALSHIIIKPWQPIRRAALVSQLPSANEHGVWLIDLGANIQQDAETLVHNALMGAMLANMNIARPKVAILNVGEEDSKGPENLHQADQILRNFTNIQYCGFIEGDAIFNGEIDVVVTDGFTGNITLKSSEGIARFIFAELRRLAASSFWLRTFAFIAQPLWRALYRKMKPDQYNGAYLVGLQHVVVKSHGNSKATGIFYALSKAIETVEKDIPNKIKTALQNINEPKNNN